MSGTDIDDPEGRGINFRALDDLFAIRESRKAEVSFLSLQCGVYLYFSQIIIKRMKCLKLGFAKSTKAMHSYSSLCGGLEFRQALH